jgi:hypothetical protein
MEARAVVINFDGDLDISRAVGGDWVVPDTTEATGTIPDNDTLDERMANEAPGMVGAGVVWVNDATTNVVAVAWQQRADAMADVAWEDGEWTGFDDEARRTNTTDNGVIVGTYPAHVQAD